MTARDRRGPKATRRGRPLSPAQLSLLRAVAAGQVAWRHHAAAGWAIRRQDVSSGGPGGRLGARVNSAVDRLAARRLLNVPTPTDLCDTPITLTAAGQATLDLTNLDGAARDDAAAMPHLPMAQDGREPFSACIDGDAPIGAVLDLTDDGYDHPGRWQRQGELWVPVAPA